MSDVAAYHILFPVQGGMWTAVHIPHYTTQALIHDMLPHHSQ